MERSGKIGKCYLAQRISEKRKEPIQVIGICDQGVIFSAGSKNCFSSGGVDMSEEVSFSVYAKHYSRVEGLRMDFSSAVASFHDEESNITSFVMVGAKGFQIYLQDDDSGNVLPSVIVKSDEGEAIREAKKIANIQE